MDIEELKKQLDETRTKNDADHTAINTKLDTLLVSISAMQGQNNLVPTIIKFVVLPLIVVLGGLIGFDLTKVINP